MQVKSSSSILRGTPAPRLVSKVAACSKMILTRWTKTPFSMLRRLHSRFAYNVTRTAKRSSRSWSRQDRLKTSMERNWTMNRHQPKLTDISKKEEGPLIPAAVNSVCLMKQMNQRRRKKLTMISQDAGTGCKTAHLTWLSMINPPTNLTKVRHSQIQTL